MLINLSGTDVSQFRAILITRYSPGVCENWH